MLGVFASRMSTIGKLGKKLLDVAQDLRKGPEDANGGAKDVPVAASSSGPGFFGREVVLDKSFGEVLRVVDSSDAAL